MEQKYPKYRFMILLLLLLALAAQPFNNFGMSALSGPIIELLNISKAQYGLLSTLVAFCMGVFAFLGGVVLANLGIKRCYALALGIMTIGGLTIGLAALIQSYPLMLVCRFVTGIGFGLMYPVKTAVIMKWFPAKERIFLNGFTLAMAYAGLMVLFQWIYKIYLALGSSVGYTLIVISGIAAFAFVMWMLFYKDTYPGLPGAEPGSAPAKKEKVRFSFAPVKEVASSKVVRYMTIAAVGHYVAYALVNTFFPMYFREKFASIITNPDELASFANGIAALMPMAGVVAILAAAFLGISVPNRKLFIWPFQILFLFGILGSIFSSNVGFVRICQLIIGVASAAWYPAFTTLPMELPSFTPSKVGVSMGFIFGFANFTQFLMGVIGGKLADAMGTGNMLFILSTIGLVISTIFCLLLPETRGRIIKSEDEFIGSGMNIRVKR
ncbi:MAG: MFS transporter [Clostridiaceae bacterium]|jgi:MFS family permease|nr:MFS transporter [Clostridiaceae bacterium]